MRVAALYDVHGNLPALEAVLADPRCASADLVVSGGDLVPGPMPRECLELLLRLGERVRFVRGNGDRQVAWDGDEASRWCRERLGSALLDEARSWPLELELRLPGGRVTFCHATPRADDEIMTRETPAGELAAAVAGAAPHVVVGHTHVQFDLSVGATRLVNAGSVGSPYEGRRGAFWALVQGPGDIELVETAYGFEAAAEAIRATGYPFAADLSANVLEPHTAEEATAEFEARRRGA